MELLKIAHISDIHFYSTTLNPLQFFSKRWVGNFNLLLNRSKEFDKCVPFELIPLFKKKGITHVLISGDLTTTSKSDEFRIAQDFVLNLKKIGIKVFAVPGNHDHYTKKADKNRIFYHYFPDVYSSEGSSFSLLKHGVTSFSLNPLWELVLLDTTVSSPLFSAEGYFSSDLEKNLNASLSQISPSKNIIVLNHYPFFDDKKPTRNLLRRKRLKAVIQSFPNILMYLHGHTHQKVIADLRPNKLPIIMNSGCSGKKGGTWNELILNAQEVSVNSYSYGKTWQLDNKQTLKLLKDPRHQKGLSNTRTKCGQYCSKEGHVRLEDDDIILLSNHLKITKEQFIKKYTRGHLMDLALTDDQLSSDRIFAENMDKSGVNSQKPTRRSKFSLWKESLKPNQNCQSFQSEDEDINFPEDSLIPINKILKKIKD